MSPWVRIVTASTMHTLICIFLKGNLALYVYVLVLYVKFSLIWCVTPSCVQYVTGDSYYLVWLNSKFLIVLSILLMILPATRIFSHNCELSFLYVVQGDQLLIGSHFEPYLFCASRPLFDDDLFWTASLRIIWSC